MIDITKHSEYLNTKSDLDELREFFLNAADFYKLLSSIYYLELTEDQINSLAEVDFDYPDDGSQMAEGCRGIKTYLKRRGLNAREDLAVDYARIFLAAGVYDGETAVPYESVYTSEDGIMMQDSRDDVVKIYAENGFKVDDDLNVPEDHLAFELEFMSRISGRIAQKLSRGEPTFDDMKTQISFIEDHLLNWIPELQDRVDNYAKLAFYPSILKITRSYIEENRAVLKETLN